MVESHEITSRRNDLVKLARALARGREVSKRPLMCIEGVRLLEDAVAGGARFETVLVSAKLAATGRGAALRDQLARSGTMVVEAADSVLASVSNTAGDQGGVGLAYKKAWQVEDLFPPARAALVVVAWGVQDPGNLGSIVRTADASGATGLIATSGSVCPYNTKCIRATMGSIFRLPIVEAEDGRQAIEMLKERGAAAVGTALSSGVCHTDIDFTGPVAIILGGEGGGLPENALAACDGSVRVPIRRGVESLNVASAAAVVLYEAARQRKFDGLL